MSVTPFPNEPTRFLVSSESRPIEHVVDMSYKEEPWMTAKAFCGCERSMAHGETCKHIRATVEYLKGLM